MPSRWREFEQRYGVPGPILVAIWGLETDYGAGLGGYSTFSALATLAYDCRRAQIYRAELIDALMLVQRGLLRPSQRGAWAGEIGQTQFMPSAYLKYAVNAQGGGGGDLISSPADALASTANFLRSKGWSPGAGWDEGQPNFNALAAMELIPGLRQDGGSVRGQARGAVNAGAQLAPMGLEHILICGGDPVSLWRGRRIWAMALPDRARQPEINRGPAVSPEKDRDACAIARADFGRRTEQFRAR